MKLYVKIFTATFIVCLVQFFVCGAGFAAEEPADYVQAYYFHASYRCKKCTTLEQYSREAIETNFKEQLGKGTLRFNEINFDETENRHFLQDFNLTYRALVLVRYKDGKQAEFKNLAKIWQLVGNKEAFLEYVKAETEAYLKEL
jgi:hypothetical protein